MDWPIFFTILGSAFAIIGCVYQFLRNFKTDIKTDINSHIDRLDATLIKVNARLDGHAQRIDQLYKVFIDEGKIQDARTDRLYQMFVDLLQAKK